MEVKQPAGQQARRSVQADPPAPGIQRPEEKHARNTQPEQQIQHTAQQPHMYAHTEDPKQVVQHAGQHAKSQSLYHSTALCGNGDAHLSGTGGPEVLCARPLHPHRSVIPRGPPPAAALRPD